MKLRDALLECEAYFYDRADADHNGERYVANTEMRMHTMVQEALAAPDPRQSAAESLAAALRHTRARLNMHLYGAGTVGAGVRDEIDAALAAWDKLT